MLRIAYGDEVRVLGLPGPYRNIEYVEGDTYMLVEHLETLEVHEVIAADVVLYTPNLARNVKAIQTTLCAPNYSDLGIYDSVFVIDNEVSHGFVICDTHERAGIFEVESETCDVNYFLVANQVKRKW